MSLSRVYLVVLALRDAGGVQRQVSVWVRGQDPAQARTLAEQAMIEAGWAGCDLIDLDVTDADDYFRTCPSEQAYRRALEQGIAWRYHQD